MAAPKLPPKSLHHAYTNLQVPISLENKQSDTCLIVILPDTSFKANGIYYQADTSDCIHKNDINIIYLQDFEDLFEPSITEIPCLNGKLDECKTEAVSCDSIMRFTKAGALVFSQNEITGVGDVEK